jgi:23S rRNA pseudouridine1911/1915/1917 synthase
MTRAAGRPGRHRIELAEDAGARLDVVVAARIPALSRSQVAQLIAAGRITVNGRAARKSEQPVAGDVIVVDVPPAEPSALVAEPIELVIVFEDADLAVVDKPAGLVVHPAPGHRAGTLVNALLHHIGDLSGIGGVRRPGIVHRLDKDTSGLLIVAKHDASHRRLSDALRRREIRRAYFVAAWGHLVRDEVEIDAPIGRSPKQRQRMAVVPAGRPARTKLKRMERWRAADLLRAELDSGRTHQIRVHLAHIGRPVVGDRVYGAGAARGVSGPDRTWAASLERRVPRQFLHAAELAFRHPISGAPLTFKSPLPPDLDAVVRWARQTSVLG